jgi:hypothetical protein
MNKLIPLALSAAALTALPAPADATVTWSFYETGIVSCNGHCSLPPQPYVLATLALPGPTSTGTARWQGAPGPAPVYTGDDFTLNTPFLRTGELSPAFDGSRNCMNANGPQVICDFDIAWSATAGGLGITLNLDAFNDNIGGMVTQGAFGSFGGPIASDSTLGGCVDTQCVVSGFWQSDLPVSEPMSAALLVTGLLGTCLARRSGSRSPKRGLA